MSQVYDPIRRRWIIATPEEVIRQKWLEVMIGHLGFPQEFILVEKSLKNLPHLHEDRSAYPERRVDILAYARSEKSEIFPLLLIECKAIKLNEKALKQVVGYHHIVGSPFIALANEDEILLGMQRRGELEIFPFLPDYNQLKKAVTLKSVVSSDHF
jgi:hypothetical protein